MFGINPLATETDRETLRQAGRVSQQRSDNVNNRTVLQTKDEDIQSLQGYQGLVRAVSN